MRNLITSVFLLLGFSVATAQISNDKEVIAEGKQNRVITKSEKAEQLPATKDTAIEIPPVKYYVEPAYYPVEFEAEPIEAAKLKVSEPLEKLYPGYVKFGVGNYTMPYLDAYYGSMRSKTNSWGINIKHQSSLGDINDVGTSQFSENYMDFFYKHFLPKHTLKTNLLYHRDVIHYYGYRMDDTLIPLTYRETDDSTRMAYNLIGFQSQLTSNSKDSSKIHHQVGLRYHYLNNVVKLQEHNVVVNTSLNKYLKSENIEINGDFEIDFNALSQPALAQIDTVGVVIPSQGTQNNTAIIRFVPYVVNNKIINKLHFKGGFGVNVDIASNKNYFYFYPEVELSYSLFNDVFIPYAGLTGGVKRNSWNNLRTDNPFLLSNTQALNTNEKINAYGGIRGAISSEWSFNVLARYQSFTNYVLYYNDNVYSYNNGFGIIYDTIGQTTFSGQLAYEKGEKFKFFGKAEYYLYNTKNQEFAWLMPDFKVTLSGNYDLADKIIARLNVYVIGNRKAFTNDSIVDVTPNDAGQYVIDLKPYVDANLGLEYRYNKRISAFIDFNNLTAAKYQRLYNYPVHRFNVLGGFTFKF
ncbi:MAG: TonB-dependent receptor [Flavobacteriales bacterium]|nr:TonB-dependent receptor [Flavobacteriales bacterium]MCB9197001.1 TonB-dependent receptor [Flavobacteriales bacterium]